MGSSDTLRSVIDAGRSSKRLDELSSARVIGKIAQQIHAAQQKAGAGKAVGPITPANIKILPSGEVKLELGDTSSLGYSSPEQISGSSGDRRSDVFSLGAVLWEALTYQRLFDAMNDAAVKIAVKEREIAPPAELNANVPAELSAICMRALSRNPTDRYQSLKAMAVELEEFLEEAGYADDDSKIAQHLTALNAPKKVEITLPPLTRKASSTEPPPMVAAAEKKGDTQPPPSALKAPAQPAQPVMLGEAPSERSKRPSGGDLAAALASASREIAKGRDTEVNGALATPAFNKTVIGVPKLDEWQDQPAPHSPPPAAAPVVSVEREASQPALAAPVAPVEPMTPLPPVLPQGSASNLRNEKATIATAVPPQVKVATTVEARHAEAKQPALIVEDKPQALIVEEPAKVGGLTDALNSIDDNKATLVDAKPPEIEVPKLVDGKPPDAAKSAPTKAEKRAKSHSEKQPRAKSQSQQGEKPHPVGAVTLGPGPKESKDVLAGWGWGTDKHTAIPPEGYVDEEYEEHAPNTKKTLMYVIGGGMGLALLVTIIAIGFGGGDDKKKKKTALGSAAVEQTTAKVAPPPPRETPQPIVAPPTPEEQAAEAERLAKEEAAKQEAAKVEAAKLEAQQKADAETLAKEEAAKTEAAKLEAAKLAKEEAAKTEAAKKEQAKLEAQQKAEAAKLEAQQKAEAAKLAKAEAAKAEAAKKEQAKLEAQQKAEAAKLAKAEAAKAEAEKKEQAKLAKTDAAKADAAKKAQAKLDAQQKADAAKLAKAEPAKPPQDPAKAAREEARIAAQQRAEAQRIARDEATAQKRAEAKARADAAKVKADTKVAKADTKETGKVDVETAYRAGLQQFARGDTTGALASLRTSLAGNPNYAPTWRGLGMVFEKMGEKDQARAAYKRYLQLAPTANDADQIRGRLERLGT